jgi:hypothetical protein
LAVFRQLSSQFGRYVGSTTFCFAMTMMASGVTRSIGFDRAVVRIPAGSQHALPTLLETSPNSPAVGLP